MIFNSEIQQILASSTAGEQFPQNTDVAYHINGFIANRDYINCVILTGNNQTLYSTEKAFTNISDYDTIFHSTWLAQLQNSHKPYLWYVDPDYTPLSAYTSGSDSADLVVSESASSHTTPGSQQHIMMARPVYSMSDYTTLLGYLMLYLDDTFLQDLMGEFDFGHTTNIWLVNKNGTAILQNNSSADYSYLLEDFSPQEKGSILSSHGKRFVLNIRPGYRKRMVSIYRHSIPGSFGTADNFCPAGDLTGRSHGSDPVFPVPADSLLPVRSYHPSGTYYGSLPQRYETNGLSRSDSGFG